jgi:hypothetical protein
MVQYKKCFKILGDMSVLFFIFFRFSTFPKFLNFGKVNGHFIAVDFSQRAGSATENRALAQINVAKARLPVFHAIR